MYPNIPGIRRAMRLMIGLIILAWATETLLHQWGFGAEPRFENAQLAGELRPNELDDQPREKFVPGTLRYLSGATLELRNETTIVGSEVKLRQVCRWADADKSAFDPIADLVVMRVGGSVPFRGLALEDLKQTLADAGVNLAVIHFAGALTCTIERNDVRTDERMALEQWIAARSSPAVATTNDARPNAAAGLATQPTAEPTVVAQTEVAEEQGPRTLRKLLVTDLAERLGIAPEMLAMKFNPLDEKLLVLTEPQFKFNLEGNRGRTLGEVSWDVTVISEAGSRKERINANARAWQQQLVVNRPLSYRQTLREEDLVEKRTLVTQLPDEPLLTRKQALGQLAARELKPGTIMTARLVEPVPLAKPGDLISITVDAGRVQVKTVARAMEAGTYGQGIKVKNEATREVFVVTLTGPQTGRMTPGGANDATVGTNVAAPNIAALDRN